MADLRFVGKNNQKKVSSTFASETLATSGTLNDTLFTLPTNSLVTDVYVIVEAASGVLASTVDIAVGGTVVADEVAVDAAGVASGTVTPTFFPTGGTVTVQAGATAPDTAGRLRVVVKYTEVDLGSGQYTD